MRASAAIRPKRKGLSFSFYDPFFCAPMFFFFSAPTGFPLSAPPFARCTLAVSPAAEAAEAALSVSPSRSHPDANLLAVPTRSLTLRYLCRLYYTSCAYIVHRHAHACRGASGAKGDSEASREISRTLRKSRHFRIAPFCATVTFGFSMLVWSTV